MINQMQRFFVVADNGGFGGFKTQLVGVNLVAAQGLFNHPAQVIVCERLCR